jgi:hypothetical protein
MRFDAGSFLLGLAALSNLPTGSGRVLYHFTPIVSHPRHLSPDLYAKFEPT